MPEHLGVEARDVLRFVVGAVQQLLADLAAETGAGADEALAIALQEVVIHARPLVVALQSGDSRQFAEVPIAFVVLGQQQKVVAVLLLSAGALLDAVGCDVSFDADEGFHTPLSTFDVELHDAEHYAVVADR